MLENSAYASKESLKSIRRLPMKKRPSAKRSSPNTTNAPTATKRFRAICSRLPCVLRRHERPDHIVVAAVQFLGRALRHDLSLVQHRKGVPQLPRARDVVRDD